MLYWILFYAISILKSYLLIYLFFGGRIQVRALLYARQVHFPWATSVIPSMICPAFSPYIFVFVFLGHKAWINCNEQSFFKLGQGKQRESNWEKIQFQKMISLFALW